MLGQLKSIFQPYFSTKEERNKTELRFNIFKVQRSLHLRRSLTSKNQDRGMCFQLFLQLLTPFSKVTMQCKSLINYNLE